MNLSHNITLAQYHSNFDTLIILKEVEQYNNPF